MCLASQGIPNGLDESTIRAAFLDWRVVSMERADLPSDASGSSRTLRLIADS